MDMPKAEDALRSGISGFTDFDSSVLNLVKWLIEDRINPSIQQGAKDWYVSDVGDQLSCAPKYLREAFETNMGISIYDFDSDWFCEVTRLCGYKVWLDIFIPRGTFGGSYAEERIYVSL